MVDLAVEEFSVEEVTVTAQEFEESLRHLWPSSRSVLEVPWAQDRNVSGSSLLQGHESGPTEPPERARLHHNSITAWKGMLKDGADCCGRTN